MLQWQRHQHQQQCQQIVEMNLTWWINWKRKNEMNMNFNELIDEKVWNFHQWQL
jgi:hypothetical protein